MEQRTYRRIQQHRRASAIEQYRLVDELDEQFEAWKWGCSIYRIHGRPSSGY
jgi:hypothetical protein